jgi:lipoate-protein ligase A
MLPTEVTPRTWYLQLDEPASGAHNMARDLALLAAVHAGGPPILRLYGWQPACLSLGAAQPAEELNLAAARPLGIDIVRRPSGGGAVLHQWEWTYAVIAPLTDPLVAGRPLEAFRRIAGLMQDSLTRLGLRLDPLIPTPPRRSAACFAYRSAYELSVNGRKLGGSAQLRRHGVLLHHGSILLDVDPVAHHALFPEADTILANLTTVRAQLGIIPPLTAWVAALRASFHDHGIILADHG